MCLSDGSEALTVEAAYGQVYRYISGKIKESELNPAVLHTLKTNMDLYQFRSLGIEKSQEVFRFAYKATLEQISSGAELYKAPPPVVLIEEIKPYVSPEDAEKSRLALLSMFEEKKNPKPLTQVEIDDLEKLNRIKSE